MKFVYLFIFLFLLSSTLTAQYSLETNFGYDEEVPYAYVNSDGIDYWYDSTTGADGHVYFTGWTQSFLVLGSMDANGEFNLNYAPDFNKYHAAEGFSTTNGYEIEMQSTNQPVVGGISILQGENVSSLFMARFTQGGNLDPTFGELGYFHYTPADQDCYLGEIIVSPTNEIFLLGRVREPGFGDMSHLIIKLTTDGQLDESFSEDGILTFNTADSNNYLSGGLLLENGQLLVAGKNNGPVNIYRINADGTVDNEFNNSGEIATSGLSEILAMKKYGDWFYAFSSGSGANSFIYKFNENGMDESYGVNGEMDLEQDGFPEDAWFTDDGKVVFTSIYAGSSYVTRADTSGVLDTGFFEGGLSSFQLSENFTALYSSTPLSDGSIITSGQGVNTWSDNSGQDFVAYKLTENGIIDNVNEAKNLEVIIYPNPFLNEIKLESESQIESIEIRDITGKVVKTQKINSTITCIKTSNLQSGIYFINVFFNGSFFSKKIIKH